MTKMSWINNYNDCNQSQRFTPAYCSDDWDDGSSTSVSALTATRGYRVSFNAVDLGWRRHGSDEYGPLDQDHSSGNNVGDPKFVSSRVNTLSWKFCIAPQNQDCVDCFEEMPDPQDLEGFEEHEICLRIIQYQPHEEPIATVATVYCTEGIRPATSNSRKHVPDDSLHIIHSSNLPANSDCETLVNCNWETWRSKEGSSPVCYAFEVIAYRHRSPMFRQYDLMINGKSFFDLPCINDDVRRKLLVSNNIHSKEEQESCNDVRRRGSKSKQKVHPTRGKEDKPNKQKHRELKSARETSRSLSPLRSCVKNGFHRKGGSLCNESPDHLNNMIQNTSRSCRSKPKGLYTNTCSSLIEASESIDTDAENHEVNAMPAKKEDRKARKNVKHHGLCALQIAFTDIDQIPISSNHISKDESTTEGDTLHYAYVFASRNAESKRLSSPKCHSNRFEFVQKVMTKMMTLVLRSEINWDTASRIVHCVATVSKNIHAALHCSRLTDWMLSNFFFCYICLLKLNCARKDDWISCCSAGVKHCIAA